MTKPIMIQGTASGAGKTVMAAALCRIFSQDGYSVSPFKSQNMTTNTALTKNRDEIAVSQFLQAYAAGIEPDARMNPVILKASSDKNGTRIVLNGKYYDTVNAYNFKEIKKSLIPEIIKAYDSLSQDYEIIVIEGAGSPIELNLTKDGSDIVNMGIAKRVNAPVMLVSDIDRGGIFASLYGTVSLLDESERSYVKALTVNRFKGDISHFADGIKILEEITGIRVAGVVPYIKFDLPEEDGLFDGGADFVCGGDYDSQFDLIADNARKALDMDLIYRIINDGI